MQAQQQEKQERSAGAREEVIQSRGEDPARDPTPWSLVPCHRVKKLLLQQIACVARPSRFPHAYSRSCPTTHSACSRTRSRCLTNPPTARPLLRRDTLAPDQVISSKRSQASEDRAAGAVSQEQETMFTLHSVNRLLATRE